MVRRSLLAAMLLGLALLLALSGRPAQAQAQVPPELSAFLDRAFAHLPANPTGYVPSTWTQAGLPTKEAVGVKSFPAVNPDKVIQRVMDVDHYVGNLGHVKTCHSVPDARFSLPLSVRFYQLVDLPIVSNLQQALVLLDLGTRNGYRLAAWYLLEPEESALDPKVAARLSYSVGFWIADSTHIGYALSSAPRREDVSSTSWWGLTRGADLLAEGVVEDNIDAMYTWASK